MQLELAQELITALYSGEYQQTQGQLGCLNTQTNQMHYCCLGVLAVIAELPRTDNKTGLELLNPKQRKPAKYYLPIEQNLLYNCHGLLPASYHMNDKGAYISLARLNDSGYTFEEIADILTILILENVIDQL